MELSCPSGMTVPLPRLAENRGALTALGFGMEVGGGTERGVLTMSMTVVLVMSEPMLQEGLAGSVSGVCDSWSQGHEFEPHFRCRAHLKKTQNKKQSAFGSGRDPGPLGSSPTSSSLHGACFSLCLCLCLSLSLYVYHK